MRMPKLTALMSRSRQSMPNVARTAPMGLGEFDYESDNDREDGEHVRDGDADVHRRLDGACGLGVSSYGFKGLRHEDAQTDAGADNAESYDDSHAQRLCYFDIHT